MSAEDGNKQGSKGEADHGMDREMSVEVAYARPDVQMVISIQVRQDATLEDAIKQSGILDVFSDIDLRVNVVSVFGKRAKFSDPLRPGDRVEINRPLIADPKQARKQRAEQAKKLLKG